MSWTEDRVNTLRKLWSEGRTAAEIAKELGGVTRNAVIGKAHRLKLSGRVSPIQQNTKKPTPVSSSSNASKPVSEKKVSAAPVIQSAISKEDENRERIALLDLGARMCRWPIGDPREQNFGFCGCQTISGLPYCTDHVRAAYQASTRNRVLKAEDLEREAEALEIRKALAG